MEKEEKMVLTDKMVTMVEDGQNGQDGEKGFDGNSSKWTMIPVGQTPVQGQISFGQQGGTSPPEWASQISLVVHPFDFFFNAILVHG